MKSEKVIDVEVKEMKNAEGEAQAVEVKKGLGEKLAEVKEKHGKKILVCITGIAIAALGYKVGKSVGLNSLAGDNLLGDSEDDDDTYDSEIEITEF